MLYEEEPHPLLSLSKSDVEMTKLWVFTSMPVGRLLEMTISLHSDSSSTARTMGQYGRASPSP